jgi:hypothetical protein
MKEIFAILLQTVVVDQQSIEEHSSFASAQATASQILQAAFMAEQ